MMNRRSLALAFGFMTLLAACGTSSEPAANTSTEPATTAPSTTMAPTTTSSTTIATTTTAEPPVTTTMEPPPAPDPITGVTVTPGGGSQEMLVNWDASVTTELLSYELYYSETPVGPYMHAASVSPTTTWHIDFPVDEAVTKPGNCYRLSAVNTGGEGPQSTESCFQPSFYPAESSGVHGGPSWGVYLATSDEADYGPERVVAIERLTDLGYTMFAYGVELSCDQGAAAALGKPSDTIAVAIYFESSYDAEAFAAAYFYEFGDQVVGTAEVETYCLD